MKKDENNGDGVDYGFAGSSESGSDGEENNNHFNAPTLQREGDDDDNHNFAVYDEDNFYDDRSVTSTNSVSNNSLSSRGVGGGVVGRLLNKKQRNPLRNPFNRQKQQCQLQQDETARGFADNNEEHIEGFETNDAVDIDYSSSHNKNNDGDDGQFDDYFDFGITNSPMKQHLNKPKLHFDARKVVGAVSHDARKVAGAVSAQVNKTMTQIASGSGHQKNHSSAPEFNSTKLSVSQIEKLAQKPGANTEIERFSVVPSYAYPKMKFNREELRQEMNKPSYYYHDLRPAPLMSKNPEQYNFRPLVGYVNVEVLQCFGIPKAGVRTETSAFCVIVCQDKAFKTDTMPHVANPMWLSKMRRACIFPIYEAYARVYLGVFGRVEGSSTRDVFIGRVVLDLSRLRPGSTYDVTLPLRQSNQVYSRQKCGSVRFRIHLTWLDERAALLSYLPKNPTSPHFEPHDTITIKCLDNKSFQNVVRTVHGHDLPGKFSMRLTKATMREFNFTRVHILRYLRKREMRDITQWRYPFMSFFIFASWMHSVYVGSLKYVPGNFVTYLVLVFFKNYCLYVIDGKHDNGFSMPTWEELIMSLLYGRPGSGHIEPLEMERKDPESCKTAAEYFDDENDHPNNSSSIVVSDHQKLRMSSLQEIADEFRDGVKRTGRRWGGTVDGVAVNTFTGTDAVDFLTSRGFAKDRVEAVELGRRLQHELHIFEHIRRKQQFKDENIFYSFLYYDTSEYVFKTHQPWFKSFARLIGFHREGMSPSEAHMEFPFASGADHPRFTIKDSLVIRSRESRNALARRESIEDDDEAAEDDNDVEKDRADASGQMDEVRDDSIPSITFDGSFYGDQAMFDTSLFTTARSDDDSDFDPNEAVQINVQDDIEIKTLPKPPNQDMLFVKKADKPIPEALSNTTNEVHRVLGHLFHDKAYKLPLETDSISPLPEGKAEEPRTSARAISDSPRTKTRKFFQSKKNSNSSFRKKDNTVVKVRKDEYDKLLHSAKYSTNNVIASRVAVVVQPIVELVQLFLSITRAQFNILTWRDPFLSFWVSAVLIVLIPILHMFPWRLVFGVAGLVLVGPQNWILRVLRERKIGGPEPYEFDIIKKRKKTIPTTANDAQEPFFFSSFTPDNRPILDHDLEKRPEAIKEVAIPHSQLMYRRCYDWPPEPEYARVWKCDAPRSNPEAQMILESSLIDMSGSDGTRDGGSSNNFPSRRRAYSNHSIGNSGSNNNNNHGNLNQRARQMVSKLRRQKGKDA